MFNPQHVKLAVNPIAWTNDDMPEMGQSNTFLQTISEIALAGYAGCELGCQFPRDPIVLTREMNRRNLQLVTGWHSTYLNILPYHEVSLSFLEHQHFLKASGASMIMVSDQSYSIQHKADKGVLADKNYLSSAQQWHQLADGLNRLGKLAHDAGMTMVYHPHMGTTIQTAAEIDRLMAMTDPRYVHLLLDTGHLTFAGENPAEVLTKHLDRILHIHLKDVRSAVREQVRREGLCFLDAVRAGVFTIPGDGCIDFDPIFSILDAHGYSGWLVVEAEQDPEKANPYDYAVMARHFISKKTGL